MEHVYFERNVITNPLLEFVRELKTSHIDLMEQIYNEEDLKNIQKISSIIKLVKSKIKIIFCINIIVKIIRK